MEPTMLRTRWSLLLVALLILQSARPATAQSEVRFAPGVVPTSVTELVENGRKLESEARWGEAISHYEQALKSHPGNDGLTQRLDLARIHYDLGRRYSDVSFRRALNEVTAESAFQLYAEVLLKINAHYVTTPAWHKIVGRGTTCVDVALGDEKFRNQHLQGVDVGRIDAFRQSLYRKVGGRVVRSRYVAQQIASEVATLANQQLGVPRTAVAMEFVSGATGGLDNYSAYLTGDQLRDIYSQIEGNFVGIGVELRADDGALLLVHVIAGSPAERAGLKAGDRIVAVEGKTTGELSTDAAASMLQGKEGTTVLISVVSPGQADRDVRVRREHVEVPSIEDVKIIDADTGVGYFKLTSFQKTTTRDLDAALWKLHREGMRSLIMDLRGNPGGLLTTAVEIVDRFVEQGTIVSTRGRSKQEDYVYTAHRPGTWRVPLVVLIDGDSASASEIFAGAIRDSRRGTIVGVTSYGKGSVQGIFPLNVAGAGVRLTTAKFFSPSGRPISNVGVSPDIVVRQAAKATDGPLVESSEDSTLEAGLSAARRQLAAR
jgi:carboxyl-terminal processing protease